MFIKLYHILFIFYNNKRHKISFVTDVIFKFQPIFFRTLFLMIVVLYLSISKFEMLIFIYYFIFIKIYFPNIKKYPSYITQILKNISIFRYDQNIYEYISILYNFIIIKKFYLYNTYRFFLNYIINHLYT